VRFAPYLLALLIFTPSAFAQSVDELKRLLEQRDAEIRDLKRQLEAQRAPAAPRVAEDDEDINRALERTLVQQGGLVLPKGVYELQPEASYARWDPSRGPLRHEWESALTFRAGLGSDSQFQVRLPYVHMVGAAGTTTNLGDISLALSKQFVREEGYWPGLIGSIGWSARTGTDGSDGRTPTGFGFNVPQVGLTAVKRSDPLVFYGGVSYARPISRTVSGSDVRPGDLLGWRLGAILAASPTTSVNVGLNLTSVSASRIGGESVPGSDTVLGTLQMGFGTVLTRNLMLNFSGEFRVSGNVPDFRLTATLPYRF
jgi:hypothetical protein